MVEVRSPPTGQEAPLGVCNIIISFFEYIFFMCRPQLIHLYHYYYRISVLCAFSSSVSFFLGYCTQSHFGKEDFYNYEAHIC